MNNRLKELREQIKYHRDKYWNEEPEIIDQEYDKLLIELKELSPEDEILKEIETNEINNNDKIKHDTPVLSLDKVYNLEDLLKWCKKVSRNEKEKFNITPKLDGMCAVYYKSKNILATRGDGEYGENITDKIPLINFEQPKGVNFGKSQQKIYGEILIKKEDFQKCKLTRKDGSVFKTERSLVSGICNPSRDDVDEIKDKIKLDFIQHNSMSEIHTIGSIKTNWNNIINKLQNIEYAIDGIVIKLQDSKYNKSLGNTSHHPKGNIAFKFPDDEYWTTVEKIDFQVGQRKITPVAYVSPTIIDGATIKKITLHNAKRVLDLDLHENDLVKIVKRGGVIPHILESKPGDNRNKPIINNCPSCGSVLEYKEPELICNNSVCDGSIKKKLVTMAKILDIEHMSDSTVSKIVDFSNGGVSNVADLLNLKYGDFMQLDGFGDRSSSKLGSNITKVVHGVEDWKILACLCLEGIGKTLSKQLLAKKNFNELQSMLLGELAEFENMGEKRAQILFDGIADNIDVINRVFSFVNVIETKIPVNNKKVIPKTICFSGSFSKSKKYYQDLAVQNNMIVSSSVTKTLNYLVSAGATTSKVTKARKYGITILNEDEFMEKIETL